MIKFSAITWPLWIFAVGNVTGLHIAFQSGFFPFIFLGSATLSNKMSEFSTMKISCGAIFILNICNTFFYVFNNTH